jgi:SAM-dependent methyltransferase
MATPWIPNDARVLDIGCHQGELLARLGDRIGESVGLDPLAHPVAHSRFRLVAQEFKEPLSFRDQSFDSIVMLATLEHIKDKAPLARECFRLLSPAGRVIITVPSPTVDVIVHGLVRCGIADGMSLDEHHGFNPWQTRELFTSHGFSVLKHRRFQLGLNHLYVFSKPDASRRPA